MSAEDQDEWDSNLESSANSSEIEDWEVLGVHALYLDSDKGLTAAHPGDSFHSCSQDFLQSLIDDLLETRAICLATRDFEDAGLDHDEVEEYLTVFSEELDRLDKHPELFPSEDMRHQFFRAVHQILQGWDAAFDKIKATQMALKDIAQEAVNEVNDLARPTYTVNRKPWQQYLHNKAPGSGIHTSEMDQEGSTQIFTPGAMRLCGNWDRVCYSIMKEIDKTHKGDPVYRPGLTIRPGHPGIAPNGLFRKIRLISPRLTIPIVSDESRTNDVFGEKELAELNLDFGFFQATQNRRLVRNAGTGVLVHDVAIPKV